MLLNWPVSVIISLMTSIGIDIGGTEIKMVLLKNGRVLKSKKVLTPKTKKDIVRIIAGHINDLKRGYKIRGVGIGVPGPVNKEGTRVLNPPNLPQLSHTSLPEILTRELRVKVAMDNDANCFTLAETFLGAGKDYDIVLGITLGTGVGGGIAYKLKAKNKKRKTILYRGVSGSAGELGHMTIKFDGLGCTCGKRGCFEEYASQRFFKKRGLHSWDLYGKARKGDKKALKVFSEYGKYLGIGIANAIDLLDPEAVIIGGGISLAYRFFIKALKDELAARIFSPISRQKVSVRKAKLGRLAGSIGAALLVQ